MPRLIIPNEPVAVTFLVGSTPNAAFPIAFPIFEKANLRVYVNDIALGQTLFTFSGSLLEGGGFQNGTVNLNTPVQNARVRIERDIPIERLTNHAPSASVTGEQLDQEANRLTAIAQEKLSFTDLVTATSDRQPDSEGTFRIGQSTDTESRGDEYANRRAPFAFIKNDMSAVGDSPGDGSEWVLHVGGYTPSSSAPPFIEQKGGIEVAVRSGRESTGTDPFSDLTGIQINTNILSGVAQGRAYGMHINNTINASGDDETGSATGGDGQAVGLEIEINQRGGVAQPNLFAENQKTALQLVPIGKMATKGIMFGTNTGGSYHTLMYVDPTSVSPALAAPVPLTNPTSMDYGGSFFRAGEIYRQCRIGDHLIEANGLVAPRHDENVVQHAYRQTGEVYSIKEIPAAAGVGHAYEEYVIEGGVSRSAGLDRASGEYRVSNTGGLADEATLIAARDAQVGLLGPVDAAPFRFREGEDVWQRTGSTSPTGSSYASYVREGVAARSIGVDNATTEFRLTSVETLDSDIIMSALPDRVGWFGSAAMVGGTRLHWTANGTPPTDIYSGTVWWFDDSGNLKWRTAGFPVRTANFTQ